MNRKIIITIIILILIAGGIYLWQRQTAEPDESGDKAQLANPASVYCEEQGGEVESRVIQSGAKGFCKFEDESECGQWDYFREECEPGEKFCKDLCGDGECQEMVCQAVGCPCSETSESCPEDCED